MSLWDRVADLARTPAVNLIAGLLSDWINDSGITPAELQAAIAGNVPLLLRAMERVGADDIAKGQALFARLSPLIGGQEYRRILEALEHAHREHVAAITKTPGGIAWYRSQMEDARRYFAGRAATPGA